ncbi:MAG: elongation factor G [Deltaproteobacteria bacterium]|nr:elongation factor G [Deltaproteobacteria bacterium]
MGARTIALIAHTGAGKTTLAEAMLVRSGVIKKPGSVENGTTVLDYEPDEKERKTTIHSGIAHFTWNNCPVDLIDAPGSLNFIGETVGAIRVADGVVMMTSGEPGVHGETDFLWEQLENQHMPRLLVISQMDRDQADFDARLEELGQQLEVPLVPIHLPVGKGGGFTGVIDLIRMQALDYTIADKPKLGEIPQELRAHALEMRHRLVENTAEADDTLLEKYLETEELTEDELLQGLKEGVLKSKLVPVLIVSRGVGVDGILNAMTTLLPDFLTRRAHRQASNGKAPPGFISDAHPLKGFAGLVFKSRVDQYAGKLSLLKVFGEELKAGTELYNVSTDHVERVPHLFKLQGKEQVEVKSLAPGEVGVLPKLGNTHTGNTLCLASEKVEYTPIEFPKPVLTYALHLAGKGEEDKLSTALHRIMEEDPTLSFHHNSETGDFLVGGMGQIHLDLVRDRLARDYNLKSEFQPPHVPYRETIRTSAKAQGKYKKQTGGRGQYGDCWLEISPNGQKSELVFESAIVGGAIPRNYIPAVEKGVHDALSKGVLAGFPVIGISAKVYDGSYHEVDSSEMAFKIAGSMAFKKAMEEGRPVLLEPVLKLNIVIPSDYMGDVMGDINSRRGRVMGMDSKGRRQIVRAEVPQSEALHYAIDLRAMTSGMGYFAQEFSHYEEVPPHVSEKLIKARNAGE